jgi:phosphatidylglycerophosphatase A
LPAEPSVRQIWLTTILGFLLFRVFDIAKPWPIRKLESLPAGWGVLADDLLAGVYAAVVLLLCMWRFVKGLS